jgi:hypothetical protein
MHYLLLLIRHRRKRDERESLFETVYKAVDDRKKKEVEAMILTDAEELKQEGRQEGLMEGQRSLLLAQLEFKFSPLPEEIRSKLERCTLEQITDLSVRVLTAQSLEEMGL